MVINIASDFIIKMIAPPPTTLDNALLFSYCSMNHLVKVTLILDSVRYYPQRLSLSDTLSRVFFCFEVFGGFWDEGVPYFGGRGGPILIENVFSLNGEDEV